MTFLLDVSVLIAPAHVGHDAAHREETTALGLRITVDGMKSVIVA